MSLDPARLDPDPMAAAGATLTDGAWSPSWAAATEPAAAPAPAPYEGALGDPDRYQVVRLLGAGGMGVVFEARDLALDRAVALKVVRSADGPAAAQARLRHEARAMARVSHPNVAALFDVGTVGERVYLAMELVRGGTLRGRGGAGRPWRELVGLLEQAGRGLAAAHAAGVIHHDVKPDNVLVGDDGVVRLTDFGLACVDGASALAAAAAGTETGPGRRPGAVAGTLAYMAPERLAGEATARSDQFAFCVMAFELLEGCRPCEVTAGEATTAERLRALLETARLPWTRPDVPARVRAIFDRGMRPDPAERWPDLPALLAALAAAIHDCGLTIHSAHIATYGERAVDVFYLTGPGGAKLSPAETDQLRARLLEAAREPARAEAV